MNKIAGYLLCLPLLLMIGCATPTFVGGFYYMPHPGLANVPATQPSQPPSVAALATVVGIRYPDDQLHLPLSVEVLLRLENNGTEAATFDPQSMQLTTGDLMRFPPAIVGTSTPLNIAPGQSVMLTADFPFPGGRPFDQYDLSSLHLRWTVQVGSKSAEQIVDFRLEDYPHYYYRPYYYDDDYPSAYPFYRRVVIVHRP
jgi:hypothetical protein